MRPKFERIIHSASKQAESTHKPFGKNVERPDELICRWCNKTFPTNPKTFLRYNAMNSSDFCSSRHRQLFYRGQINE